MPKSKKKFKRNILPINDELEIIIVTLCILKKFVSKLLFDVNSNSAVFDI